MHHDRSAKCYARMCRTWPYSLLCAYMRVSALLALWTETLFFNVYDRITVSKLHALSNRGDGHGFGDGHGLWFGRMVTVCIGGNTWSSSSSSSWTSSSLPPRDVPLHISRTCKLVGANISVRCMRKSLRQCRSATWHLNHRLKIASNTLS
jgi:hypothetical protein